MDERRLHSSAWIHAVEEVRKEIGMPTADEQALAEWLSGSEGMIQDAVLHAFTGLALETGLSLRYLNYFLACALSHHSGGTLHHSLPENMIFSTLPMTSRALKADLFTADGYYRVEYSPFRTQVPGFTWRPVAPPRGFSVAWPNMQYSDLYQDLLDELRKEVKEKLRENLLWVVRPGHIIYSHEPEGTVRDGWLFYGPGVENKPLHEVLGVPAGTIIQPSVAPIPVVVLTGEVIGINLRGGAPLDEWRRPRVERDPVLDKEGGALADRCERVIGLLAGNPALSGALGGRPPTTRPTPGTKYKDYVLEQYSQELARLRDRPTGNHRRQIRGRVLKRAERQFTQDEREGLKRDWYKQVEAEEPWRKGKG